MKRTPFPTGKYLNQEAGVRRSSHVFNRQAPDAPRPWFKVDNKASSDTTVVEIMDEIGGWWGVTAKDFISQLKEIETPKIELHINSPGGEVFDGVAIYNALKNHDAEVTVYVDALAASAASFIAQAGDKIIMSKGSTMMIHDGLAFCVGNEKDMLDTANVLSKISNNIAELYADRAGGTTEEWRALMREEVWYTASEAVDAGLADEVASSTAPAEAVAATNKWDLSIFNHAGRADAPSPAEVRSQIINRAKEAPVTQPKIKASDETAADPNKVEPNQPGTPSDPLPEVTEPPTPGEEEGTEQEPEAPNGGPAPEGTPTNKASAFTVLVNKVATTDPKAIQAHIDSLELFRNETRDQGRKDFVAKLAHEGKISASAIDKLEAFALGLDDAQYEAWKGVYDTAPALRVLGQHTNVSNPDGDESQRETAVTEKIDMLKGVVQQHKLSGMAEDKIKTTKSYQQLIALVPSFEL